MKLDKVLDLVYAVQIEIFDWQPFYASPRLNIIGSLAGRVARAHA